MKGTLEDIIDVAESGHHHGHALRSLRTIKHYISSSNYAKALEYIVSMI